VPALRRPLFVHAEAVAGDLVGASTRGRCIAHGGLGWVYLAQDKNVSDRWVVLKGLLDSKTSRQCRRPSQNGGSSPKSEHPNIVKIYNFVQHKDAATS